MEKVILQDRATKKYTLPETKAEVEVYASLLIGDLEGIQESQDDVKSSIKVLSRLIKNWNIYRDNDASEPLPITEENVSRLPLNDLNHLMEQVQSFVAQEKKE